MPRGAHIPETLSYQGQMNRPVIQWEKDGLLTTFTERQCREELGFRSLVVYNSGLRSNACAIESSLQRPIHDFECPCRLHRHVGMGDEFDSDKLTHPNFLVSTFFAYVKSSVFEYVSPEHGNVWVVY